ncbi:asparagine-tRNA ligase [Verruconis gallopava]|uniref:asparagine--tRNA ligase n=1 Tax=Verruconis gallopava TaxID=253628 RepID=A0A0D1YY31_9PEZI|nr:asparagine-tRNA ligase [Verruconis gallopava]KIW05577.1 asparagine-tRNA ligase [Verruconis gallopava]
MAESQKTIYVDEKAGKDDASATGTESAPYQSLAYAYIQNDGQGTYLQRKYEEGKEPEYAPASKAGTKKAATALATHKKKQAKEAELAVRQKKEQEAREKALEDAKKIVITEDESLPKPIRIRLDQTGDSIVLHKEGSEEKGTRVKVLGRAHHIRKQKDVMFVVLKDGYGKMQCVFAGDLAKTYDAVTLTQETTMEIIGELYEVPSGAQAPLGRELRVDFFRVEPKFKAPGGDDAITTRVAPDADPQTKMDLRHLTLRGDNSSSILLVRDAVEFAFNTVYKELRMRKVSPPALVQTQVEGGATLFSFDYYGEKAYLTQSSQLYLETVLPSLGNVYCIEKSFRAEKSLTRRHLSEYTHIEAELDFITFNDLLDHLEYVICAVLKKTLADPEVAAIIKKLNPEFKMPEQPFLRMKYSDAIAWLNEHNILTDEGKPHEFGDDIAEAAERKMTDEINRPIFLTHFPVEIKSFYMYRDPSDPRVTESVDVLMPGVGEIVGGSMRMDDYEELMQGYKREGIDPTDYYWYTDQRRYGSSPHGGYGLGLERFLAWLCNQWTVRDTCLYPRFMGRCKP